MPAAAGRCWPPGRSAVAPDRLGDYLADLRSLLERHRLTPASLYGPLREGCVHLRIPFPLGTPAGSQAYRSFLQDAADLVIRYGGSLSGEHGDGHVRGELLTRMFPPELVEDFGRIKALFDPQDRMNPGKVAAPYPLDTHLRLGPDYPAWEPAVAFAYPEDGGSFARAATRASGSGSAGPPSPTLPAP